MMRLRLVRFIPLMFLAMSVWLTNFAAAQAVCDSSGYGPPGVVGPTATATSIAVAWLELCPVIPSSMQLRQGGTLQNNFQDGTLLGVEGLAPLENGGAVTASDLAPLTSYLNLRLCGTYPSPAQPECSASFGAATLAEAGTPTPTITQAVPTQTSIDLAWSGNTNYASYNVSQLLSSLTLIGQPMQYSVAGGSSGTYTFMGLMPATSYQIQVQGCNPGESSSNCSIWASKTVVTDALPPPPVLGPQNLHTVSNSVSSIMVLWTDPPGVQSATTTRVPPYTVGGTYQNIPGGIQDDTVVSGKLYTYTVCLHYGNGQACGVATGASQVPPPVPVGCRGSSVIYGTVEVECYTYPSTNNSMISYDAVDPMFLQRLGPNGNWAVVDDGSSNPWDVPPPRRSVPYFQDSSFQMEVSPPATATYRVVATNQWAQSPSLSFTVTIDLKVAPVVFPGPPLCGPGSSPYRPCLLMALPPGNHVQGVR
jgi:hypothetical protein